MIDPDNAKDSLLEEIVWSESALREHVRARINAPGIACTFEPSLLAGTSFEIWLRCLVACQGESVKKLFESLKRLEREGIILGYERCDSLKGNLRTFIFMAKRFRQDDSTDVEILK